SASVLRTTNVDDLPVEVQVADLQAEHFTISLRGSEGFLRSQATRNKLLGFDRDFLRTGRSGIAPYVF
ncbi:MAG TPA: hypothetical protein VMF91_27920, partial [Bryobacteraceae bacterium]|nr:hypothetical protein [Bryobacteraceae bacterium]